MNNTNTVSPSGGKVPGSVTDATRKGKTGTKTAPETTTATPETVKEPGDMLREIVRDRRKLRQLEEARRRITAAMKPIRDRIADNERAVYEPYEAEAQEASEPLADTLRQLELF